MNITFDFDDKRHQLIEFNSDDPIQYTHTITRHDVDIQITNQQNTPTEDPSAAAASNDANQVFSQPIIDHRWDLRYYAGHLIATCGQFVAYALKPQSGDDIVCVFYKQVDFRSVINPPFSGDIHDLAFSFSDDVLLACVDQACHLRIYRIEKVDEPSELQHTLILFVDLQYSNDLCPSILSWCCFIPDSNDGEDNDAYTMMSITRGSHVEVLNVAIASQSCISENMLVLNQIENGRLTYEDNNGNVTCVCFSPDGTALGTGTDKGEIKFFSINFDQPKTCRCLHLWIPHEGRPISSLFFLDDHKNLTQDTQLWRYAVSGCDQNRELKVWSCTNWSCLQIVRFQYSAFHSPAQCPMLKASIDLTSRFLVLSDIHQNSIYVLTIYQDADNNRAHFSSINAFTDLNSPSLSLAITAADQLQRRLNEPNDRVDYAVKMYSIQTKSFQEILLVFKTQRFMNSSATSVDDPHSVQDNLIEDFRFEPYLSYLATENVPHSRHRRLTSMNNESMANPTHRIDDLLTPNSSLTNIASLSNGDKRCAFGPSARDPFHGLVLGNTTAFDAVSTHVHASEGLRRSPYDLEDKEVAESMSCAPNYSLQFETLPDDDDDEVDAVFIPIKSDGANEPTNASQDPLTSPQKYLHSTGESPLMDPTEMRYDSTADDDELPPTRPKRRTGRSPASSQTVSGADALHEIRQLTHLLNEFRSHKTSHSSDSMVLSSSINRSDYEDKLEQCCDRLDQLTSKVDRLRSHEVSSGAPRPSRPNSNAASADASTTNEVQATLADVHYDQLEGILVEKIQTYLQDGIKSAFDPYQDMKEKLHKDLAGKLLATDAVIKQTITQIFRAKPTIETLSNAVANAIQSAVTTSYRETFNQVVIPSFEKAATNMFQQTNEVFRRGTKEYLQEMIEYGRQQQWSLMQQREQMMTEIRQESTQLTQECEKKNQELTSTLKIELAQYMTSSLTPLVRQSAQSVLQVETASVLRELLTAHRQDMNTSLRQALTVQPVSTSVPPTMDVKQQHVAKLIHQGQWNQAFEWVLSAADLSLVLYLCQNVRPTELFAIQPCPLQIPVLLSLIQQLAADLTTHQELKYSYLHEALICLDVAHPSVQDYLQHVLIDLSRRLMLYIQAHPAEAITKRFQLLWMASQGILQKIAQQRVTPIKHIPSPSK